MLRKIILFFIFNIIFLPVFSQVKQKEKRDSSYIYTRIENFSNKRKFTHLIYGLIFRPVTPRIVVTVKKKKVPAKKKISYEGKIIRNINIVTYDPFVIGSGDTTLMRYDLISKTGNALHVKTIPFKIKNLLMVKKFDTYDSLRIKESERLIRSQSFIREVSIKPVGVGKDSVDLFIKVYDVWSIIAVGSYSPSNFLIDLRDKNFGGMGHQFKGTYKYDYKIGKSSYKADYHIPTISNTFFNADMHYKFDEQKNYSESISLNRPFYSILTSWAGGITMAQNLNREKLYGQDSVAFSQTYKSNYQDYWIGRSWQLFKGKTEEKRATNLISSFRFYRTNYVQRAAEEFDTAHVHANENFYLAGIGVSKRIYKQDNYIFRYGYTEDVPTGRSFSIVGGYQIREKVTRWYVGSRIYMANYHNWGYFNLYMEYGNYFHLGKYEEGCAIAGINYFSGLIRIGRWKLRQFIKPQGSFGFKRAETDNLSLSSDPGIKGFNSGILKGTQKLTFTFQLQSYAPWNIIGFRFGPYLVCSFGMLGTEVHGFAKSPLYSSFGIGLLIKNDYLLMSSFQISIAYYPIIPGVGQNIIKTNPVKASDFGYRSFDIDQPRTIVYQ